jgi:hypothetical protein
MPFECNLQRYTAAEDAAGAAAATSAAAGGGGIKSKGKTKGGSQWVTVG